MHVALNLVVLVAVVVTVGSVARRWDLPAPLLLVIVGFAGSFIPRFEDFHLEPDVVLVGLLPPLLYSAAIRTSLIDFRQHIRPIVSLSVGLVAFTTVGVGLIAWWLLPIPLAAGFAIGAVVAPPDAVAATAIARRVGLPRQVVTILEGESLVNDATALVCLRAATAAIAGSVTAAEVTGDFAVSAVGGVGAGLVVALVASQVRMRVDDTLTDTSIALSTPFLAYVIAEEIHASGVLAVVVAGLILGHKATVLQSARARIFERSNWATIQFLLEGAVFVLIGLEVRSIVEAVGDSSLGTGRIVAATAACVLGVMILRPLWVLASTYVLLQRQAGAGMPWRSLVVVSWAGMRGVVTLAAAFVLPENTPHREVLVLIALCVTAVTLLLQGFTLPAVIRRSGLRPPDPLADALQQAEVLQRAAVVGRARLAELDTDGVRADVLERLQRRSIDRADAVWEQLGGEAETPSQAYARLRMEMIAAERQEVLRIRDKGTVPHEVLQQVLAALDVEESIIEVATIVGRERRDELHAAGVHPTGCTHLAATTLDPSPRTPDGCEECLAEGLTWVHLRLCLDCGHVGCCDSSEGRHATAHFHDEGHPVMRSFEPGEAWRWCYVDEILG